MSKPRVDPTFGISSVDVLILTERHPACRWREAPCKERENLAGDAKVPTRLRRGKAVRSMRRSLICSVSCSRIPPIPDRQSMSESGPKRKCPGSRGTSVLPSGADIVSLPQHVRLVPLAAVSRCSELSYETGQWSIRGLRPKSKTAWGHPTYRP